MAADKTIIQLFVILSVYKWCNGENSFKSVPVTVKTYENDTVLLPCYVDDTEHKLRVRWYKDEHLVADSMDAHRLLPPRLRMHANYSLELDALVARDTAEYTCEVIRPQPWGPIRQTHSIEVQYSPTVRTIPDDGFVEVRKGEYVDIGCDATGTPPPIVNWRKNGEPMALLEPRSRLKFRAEHRLLAGVYECLVTNGVGDTVKAAIRVIIHDAPVVSAERTFVHTAVGLRAALAAKLEFEVPPARTNWYRDGRPVKTDDRFGWSKPSAILHFATAPGVGRGLPTTSDYTDIAPILEESESESHNISQAHVFERVLSSSAARENSAASAILFFTIMAMVRFS